jgi:hypothetical protein
MDPNLPQLADIPHLATNPRNAYMGMEEEGAP